ncbi:hypothetical protein J1N35_008390 [Gossypium stocksii]|uniref:DUF4283 domain-containing protein n=1 Tax=Gossypium stocksii TaxID=47602 RepID=A0A9D3W8R9_9ROSI|nr:hypothetical protein J1N35_008390 [Gossypium stocksii]
MVLAWIRFPGLLGFLYKKKTLEEIRVGKVVPLDLNTDSRTRGRFTRIAVYVNLEKPLIAQVIVNEIPQKVEYKGLPTICFTCGKYGYSNELCVSSQSEIESGKDQAEVSSAKGKKNKEKDEQSVDFNNTLRDKNRSIPSSKRNGQTGGNRDEVGPVRPIGDGPLKERNVGLSPAVTPMVKAAAGPSKSMVDMDSICSVPIQPFGILDFSCTEPINQVNEAMESAKIAQAVSIVRINESKAFGPGTGKGNQA